MTTTWQALEYERQQSGVPIARVQWTCDHHPLPVIRPTQPRPKQGACLDCRQPIAIESRRCGSCARRASAVYRSLIVR